MKYEQSAGIVVYRCQQEKRIILMLHYQSGHWDFPKGHLEKGEDNQAAAVRELAEETGLKKIQLDPQFLCKITYFFYRQGQKVKKDVSFFLGQTRQKKVVLSPEHIGYEWLEIDEAIERATYPTAKKVLKQAKKYLE